MYFGFIFCPSPQDYLQIFESLINIGKGKGKGKGKAFPLQA
jgi:hypothetical protein